MTPHASATDQQVASAIADYARNSALYEACNGCTITTEVKPSKTGGLAEVKVNFERAGVKEAQLTFKDHRFAGLTGNNVSKTFGALKKLLDTHLMMAIGVPKKFEVSIQPRDIKQGTGLQTGWAGIHFKNRVLTSFGGVVAGLESHFARPFKNNASWSVRPKRGSERVQLNLPKAGRGFANTAARYGARLRDFGRKH